MSEQSYATAAIPAPPTFESLKGEQAKTHEIISQLMDKLRPVIIQRPEAPGGSPSEVAPSQMSERLQDQESINRRLHSLLVDIDL